MRIINKLGEELIARKEVLIDYATRNINPFALEDTKYIINEKYYKAGLINDEVRNALLNSAVTVAEFESLLLKIDKYKKTRQQIEEEIAVFADNLLNQLKIQEVPVVKSELRISNDLQSLDIYKTVKVTKTMMQNYIGLENNEESYIKIASKCVVPFFILRIKKIMADFCRSELLKSNNIRTEFTPVYTKNEKDINEPIMIDFVIKININNLERNENYNDIASFTRVALEQLDLYFRERTLD